MIIKLQSQMYCLKFYHILYVIMKTCTIASILSERLK